VPLQADVILRELAADLPNAVKRDADRARATIRQYVGDKILVAEEIQDGQPVVPFRSNRGHMEAAFLRVAGSSTLLQTNVVAGARYAYFRRRRALKRAAWP
jgi:hypothetical protein